MQMATSLETDNGEMIVKRVSVPIGLEELMEGLTKEVVLKKPKDIYVFASEYFSHLLNLREKGSYKEFSVKRTQSVIKQTTKDESKNLRLTKSKSIGPAVKQLTKQISVRSDLTSKKPTFNAIERNKLLLDKRKISKKQSIDADKKSSSSSEKDTPRSVRSDKSQKSLTTKRDRSVTDSNRGTSSEDERGKVGKNTPRKKIASESSKSNKETRSRETSRKSKDLHRDISVEGNAKKIIKRSSSRELISKKDDSVPTLADESVVHAASGINSKPDENLDEQHMSKITEEVEVTKIDEDKRKTTVSVAKEEDKDKSIRKTQEELIEKKREDKVQSEDKEIRSEENKENIKSDGVKEQKGIDENKDNSEKKETVDENVKDIKDKNIIQGLQDESVENINETENLMNIEESQKSEKKSLNEKVSKIDENEKLSSEPKDKITEITKTDTEKETATMSDQNQKNMETDSVKEQNEKEKDIEETKTNLKQDIKDNKNEDMKQSTTNVSHHNVEETEKLTNTQKNQEFKDKDSSDKISEKDERGEKINKSESEATEITKSHIIEIESDQNRKENERDVAKEDVTEKDEIDKSKVSEKIEVVKEDFKDKIETVTIAEHVEKNKGTEKEIEDTSKKDESIGKTSQLEYKKIEIRESSTKDVESDKNQKSIEKDAIKKELAGTTENETNEKIESTKTGINDSKKDNLKQVKTDESGKDIKKLETQINMQEDQKSEIKILEKEISKKDDDGSTSNKPVGNVTDKFAKNDMSESTLINQTDERQTDKINNENEEIETKPVNEDKNSEKEKQEINEDKIVVEDKVTKGVKDKTEEPLEVKKASINNSQEENVLMVSSNKDESLVRLTEDESSKSKISTSIENHSEIENGKKIVKSKDELKTEEETQDKDSMEQITKPVEKISQDSKKGFEESSLEKDERKISSPKLLDEEKEIDQNVKSEEEVKDFKTVNENESIEQLSDKEIKDRNKVDGNISSEDQKLENKIISDKLEKTTKDIEDKKDVFDDKNENVNKKEEQANKILEEIAKTGKTVVPVVLKLGTTENIRNKTTEESIDKFLSDSKKGNVAKDEIGEETKSVTKLKNSKSKSLSQNNFKIKSAEIKDVAKDKEIIKIKRTKSESKPRKGDQTDKPKNKKEKEKLEVNGKKTKQTHDESTDKKPEIVKNGLLTTESKKPLNKKSATLSEIKNIENQENEESKILHRQQSFDSSKLRTELKEIEKVHKYTSFTPSFNPYKLHEEIKQASQEQNVNKEKLITQAAAVLKIQSLWRGFSVRKHLSNLKLNQTIDSKENNKNFVNNVTTDEEVARILIENQALIQNQKDKETGEKIAAKESDLKPEKILELKKDEEKSKEIEDKAPANEKIKESSKPIEERPLNNSESKEISFQKAALKIQAFWRGFHVRKHIVQGDLFGKPVESKKLNSQPEILKTVENHDKSAALKIQSLWRGYLVRKNIKDVKKRIAELQKPSKCDEMPNQRTLTDEDILNAATKIQAGTRGYITRKHLSENKFTSIAEERAEGNVTKNLGLDEAIKQLDQIVVPIDSPDVQASKKELVKSVTVDEPEIVPKIATKLTKAFSADSIKSQEEKLKTNSIDDDVDKENETNIVNDLKHNLEEIKEEMKENLTETEREVKEAIRNITENNNVEYDENGEKVLNKNVPYESEENKQTKINENNNNLKQGTEQIKLDNMIQSDEKYVNESYKEDNKNNSKESNKTNEFSSPNKQINLISKSVPNSSVYETISTSIDTSENEIESSFQNDATELSKVDEKNQQLNGKEIDKKEIENKSELKLENTNQFQKAVDKNDKINEKDGSHVIKVKVKEVESSINKTDDSKRPLSIESTTSADSVITVISKDESKEKLDDEKPLNDKSKTETKPAQNVDIFQIDEEKAEKDKNKNETLNNVNAAATKIQSSYRGYRVRRDLKAVETNTSIENEPDSTNGDLGKKLKPNELIEVSQKHSDTEKLTKEQDLVSNDKNLKLKESRSKDSVEENKIKRDECHKFLEYETNFINERNQISDKEKENAVSEEANIIKKENHESQVSDKAAKVSSKDVRLESETIKTEIESAKNKSEKDLESSLQKSDNNSHLKEELEGSKIEHQNESKTLESSPESVCEITKAKKEGENERNEKQKISAIKSDNNDNELIKESSLESQSKDQKTGRELLEKDAIKKSLKSKSTEKNEEAIKPTDISVEEITDKKYDEISSTENKVLFKSNDVENILISIKKEDEQIEGKSKFQNEIKSESSEIIKDAAQMITTKDNIQKPEFESKDQEKQVNVKIENKKLSSSKDSLIKLSNKTEDNADGKEVENNASDKTLDKTEEDASKGTESKTELKLNESIGIEKESVVVSEKEEKYDKKCDIIDKSEFSEAAKNKIGLDKEEAKVSDIDKSKTPKESLDTKNKIDSISELSKDESFNKNEQMAQAGLIPVLENKMQRTESSNSIPNAEENIITNIQEKLEISKNESIQPTDKDDKSDYSSNINKTDANEINETEKISSQFQPLSNLKENQVRKISEKIQEEDKNKITSIQNDFDVNKNQQGTETGTKLNIISNEKISTTVNDEQSHKLQSTPGLLHTSEFHDTITIPTTIPKIPTTGNEERKDFGSQTTSPEGLINTGELHDSVYPLAVQLNQAPAGVEILTSLSSYSINDDDHAQASNKDASTSSKAQSNKISSATSAVNMETEKRNNASIYNNRKSMETEAATKIQAGFRGYQVRKQLKKINSSGDISKSRRLTRRKSSGRISQQKSKDLQDLEEKSAVKIQAGVRGFLVRRRQKKQKQPKESL